MEFNNTFILLSYNFSVIQYLTISNWDSTPNSSKLFECSLTYFSSIDLLASLSNMSTIFLECNLQHVKNLAGAAYRMYWLFQENPLGFESIPNDKQIVFQSWSWFAALFHSLHTLEQKDSSRGPRKENIMNSMLVDGKMSGYGKKSKTTPKRVK